MGGIYLRQGKDLVAMREQPYEAESLLQELIAEHPEVVAGDDQDDGRTWILIKREAGIADTTDGADRFSLDHLFLDEPGIPTLIEVKRSSDTRARREVVAQMLDYAANATAHWNSETLRAWFEAECERKGIEPQAALDNAFGSVAEDSYWDTVRRNLAADRIRLVFVADEISAELRSIVEFLNRNLTEPEVLAIEVKQYVDADGDRQTIVPRVLGQTQETKEAKGGGGGKARRWDEASLISEIARRQGVETSEIASAVIGWASAREDVRVTYGKGAHDGSANIRFDEDGVSLHAFNIWTGGGVEIPFDFMGFRSQAPFAESREARDELRRQVNQAVPAANVPPEEERVRPSFGLTALADEQARLGFFAAMEWAFGQAREAQSAEAAMTAPRALQ